MIFVFASICNVSLRSFPLSSDGSQAMQLTDATRAMRKQTGRKLAVKRVVLGLLCRLELDQGDESSESEAIQDDGSGAKPGRQPLGLSLCLAASRKTISTLSRGSHRSAVAAAAVLSVCVFHIWLLCVFHICLQACPPPRSMRQEASVGKAWRERETGASEAVRLPVSSTPRTHWH